MRSETSALGAKSLIKKLFLKLGNGMIFGIGAIFSIGIFFIVYAAGRSVMTPVTSGSGLSANAWNQMIDNLNDLNSRINNFSFSAGNIGIGKTPSVKLDVNGNIISTPILARWNIELPYQLANTNLNWNSEIFNTNPLYIQRNANGTGINILIAGHYQINVKVLQYGMCDGCRGDVYLRKNGANIGSMIGYGGPSPQQYFYHSFNNLYYFNAGDIVTVYSESYPVHPGSSLEIIKLN